LLADTRWHCKNLPRTKAPAYLDFAVSDDGKKMFFNLVCQNPEELNDSVFTMMHHVSGDLNCPESLFIPQVKNKT
jgi:hypothetical protein